MKLVFAAITALAAAACTGAITGEESQRGQEPNDQTVGSDGLIRDKDGNVLCDTKVKDCSAFTDGYDIGGASMGRLNRNQYGRTIKDLLGTTLSPQFTFPDDELVHGFDTIGATLRVSPEHMEQYLGASEVLIDELFARPATDPLRTRYLSCDPASGADCWRTSLTTFATKAWRRPVLATEIDRFVTLVTTEAADLAPDVALKSGMRAVLLSPYFMYRIELDPSVEDATPHALGAYEVATRLSYFLWGTMPDDALFAAAASQALLDEAGLIQELGRMLSDVTRAQALVDEFGAQWLNVYKVRGVAPDGVVYPSFDDPLREAMVSETQLLLDDVFKSEQPISGLLTAQYSFVNARLAQHYGLPNVTGDGFQRVELAGSVRRGILTHGSFLAGTSNPTRTSPVKRGKHVLERMLCSPPPDPPGDIDLNIDEGSGLENLSVRDRLAKHQEKGAGCAGCHVMMDAIGLGLENFDGIGSYRTSDEYGAINATGELPAADGSGNVSFDGAVQLADILAGDERLVTCLTEKMLTFGLGRGFKPEQHGMIDVIAAYARIKGGSFRTTLQTILTSDAFRQRRALLPSEL
jgi:hypothetical protein